jgi:exodeoxyribonuclease I
LATPAPASTLLWHDYETFGANPAHDFPAQFAAIRTNMAFEPIGEPVSFYCQPPPDYLPHPIACLITGITPQFCLQHGLPEREFAARIHFEMAAASTTAVGYNSMRFDEEFTRQLLWRNFFPVYAREFQHGNARFDLIDVMRMAYALRPDGLHWPSVEGKPSFKLELLAQANGLVHRHAHDALSDVEALIALARQLKSAQPKLWEYAFSLRRKAAVSALIDYTNHEPLVHVSQRFPAERGCLALWLPICAHPARANEIIGVDLAAPIDPLLSLDSDAIAERIFVRQMDLPEGETRIALKTLHLNRAPMLAKLSVLKSANLTRLALHDGAESPLALQLARAEKLRNSPDLAAKLRTVFASNDAQRSLQQIPTGRIDTALYAGFLPDSDANLLSRVRTADPTAFATLSKQFRDPRLPELLRQYQARQFPESLSVAAQKSWQNERRNWLNDGAPMTHARFAAEIEAARSRPLSVGKHDVLDALVAYEQSLREGI